MQNRTILVSSIIFSWCHLPILCLLSLFLFHSGCAYMTIESRTHSQIWPTL